MSAFFFRKLNTVFLHNPKTGGLSIRAGAFKDDWTRGNDGPYFDHIPEDWPMDRSFATVRDPLDRFLSGLSFCRQRHPVEEIEDIPYLIRMLSDPRATSDVDDRLGWIKHHLMLQTSPELFLNRAKILMRFETLEEDFQMVCRAFDLGSRELPHTNEGKLPKAELSQWELHLVLEYLRPDYERFDFYKMP